MRVFICFEGSCEPFDIPPDQTVGAVKQLVKESFLVQLSNDNQVCQYLELSYGGAALQDGWALCDVGITSCSAIRCLIKSEQRPVVRVFNAVTGETLPIMGSEALLHTSIATLKTLVSIQSGLPVSAFRLSTAAGVQLYDCNQLQEYDIEIGTTLRLDTWDGWVEFLQGCLLGHRLKVQSHLAEKKPVMRTVSCAYLVHNPSPYTGESLKAFKSIEAYWYFTSGWADDLKVFHLDKKKLFLITGRFQLQVALYIAASLGHLDLADWLLERGMHPEEPVGVHPYRQWCHRTAHRDTGKCPIHIAAENNQLLILKLFIARNPLALACRDPAGRDPLKVALQGGHRDCVRYLANKLCSVVSLPNTSLPMRIYLQIKLWLSVAQKRSASNRCHNTCAALKAGMGDTLLVDGFNQPNMSSKSSKAVTKRTRKIKAKTLQPLPPITNSLPVSYLPSTTPPSRLSVNPVNPAYCKEMHKKQRQDGLSDEISKEDGREKFILPPISSRESITRLMLIHGSPSSQMSLSHHCGRTPRENAVYCWNIASTFTEKPWSKQLSIARTLIRKHTVA